MSSPEPRGLQPSTPRKSTEGLSGGVPKWGALGAVPQTPAPRKPRSPMVQGSASSLLGPCPKKFLESSGESRVVGRGPNPPLPPVQGSVTPPAGLPAPSVSWALLVECPALREPWRLLRVESHPERQVGWTEVAATSQRWFVPSSWLRGHRLSRTQGTLHHPVEIKRVGATSAQIWPLLAPRQPLRAAEPPGQKWLGVPWRGSLSKAGCECPGSTDLPKDRHESSSA